MSSFHTYPGSLVTSKHCPTTFTSPTTNDITPKWPPSIWTGMCLSCFKPPAMFTLG